MVTHPCQRKRCLYVCVAITMHKTKPKKSTAIGAKHRRSIFRSRIPRLSVIALLTILSIGCDLALSYTVETVPRKLSSAERSKLESLVCIRHFGTKASVIEAFDEAGASAFKRRIADVQCKAHVMVADHSISGRSNCSVESTTWRCKDPELVLSFSKRDRLYEIKLGSVEPAVAKEVFFGLIEQNAYVVNQAKSSKSAVCFIGRAPKPELYEISCDGWQAIVSTWCPPGPCPRVLSHGPSPVP